MLFLMQIACILNNKKDKWGASHCEAPRFFLSAASAAAGEKNDSYDDKPDQLVIKNVAKTVVHIMSSVNV